MGEFRIGDVVLRPPVPEDGPQIYKNFTGDPAVTKYLTWRTHANEQESIERIAFCISEINKPQVLRFVIDRSNGETAVGMIEGRIDGHRAEIGYVLGRKFWNRGIMTDALKGIIQILFRDKAIERVWATHHVENVASGRVMAKAGMQCEGILRKYLLTPNLEPPARDAAIYSVTRESCRMDLPPEGS